VDIIRDPPSDAEYLWQGGTKFNELLRALLEYLISTDFVLPFSNYADVERLLGKDD